MAIVDCFPQTLSTETRAPCRIMNLTSLDILLSKVRLVVGSMQVDEIDVDFRLTTLKPLHTQFGKDWG